MGVAIACTHIGRAIAPRVSINGDGKETTGLIVSQGNRQYRGIGGGSLRAYIRCRLFGGRIPSHLEPSDEQLKLRLRAFEALTEWNVGGSLIDFAFAPHRRQTRHGATAPLPM